MIEIVFQPRFRKNFKRLPKKIREIAIKRTALFRKQPHAPNLRLHKLHGTLTDFHAFSVTHSHRIVVQFLEKNLAVFVDIGDHSIYH